MLSVCWFRLILLVFHHICLLFFSFDFFVIAFFFSSFLLVNNFVYTSTCPFTHISFQEGRGSTRQFLSVTLIERVTCSSLLSMLRARKIALFIFETLKSIALRKTVCFQQRMKNIYSHFAEINIFRLSQTSINCEQTTDHCNDYIIKLGTVYTANRQTQQPQSQQQQTQKTNNNENKGEKII